MTTNELVRAADINIDELGRMGRMLATSGYFDRDHDLNVAIAQMAVKVMAGRELGYGPFASANGIHIIKGKPAVSANLMAAAVKAHPRYDYRVKRMDNDAVEIEFFDNGESLGVSSFTKADADAAGTQNMTKFARNMLFARAISNGVKWFCPDVFAGNAVYVPEELGAEVDGNGDVIGYTVVEQDNGNGTQATQPDIDIGVDENGRPDVPELDPGDVEASAEWTETTSNGTQPAQTASDGDAIWQTWNKPLDAWAWAVENGYRSSQESAVNVWNQVAVELGGYSTRKKFVPFAQAYYDRCIADGVKEAA